MTETLPPATDLLRDRNNTSYSKALHDFILTIPKDTPNLQYHQKLVLDYVLRATNKNLRGILINHGMGAGKTRLGISICEGILEKYPEYKVVFLANKSLHSNAVDTLREYTNFTGRKMSEEEFQKYLKERYTMISLNASNMYDQVARSQTVQDQIDIGDELGLDLGHSEAIVNLDDCVLVVDEAHNFFNSIVNGSNNAVRLYHLIMSAERIRIVFMTGSPIINNPFEVALGFNMLAGYLDRNKSVTLFGEDYSIFSKSFCPDDPDMNPDDDPMELVGSEQKLRLPVIQNKGKFQNRIIGLTSTYHPSHAESKEAEKLREHFPTLNPLRIDRIPMSSRQFGAYAEAREREVAEMKRAMIRPQPKGLSKGQGPSSTYRVRSRQFSNIVYPEEAMERKVDEKGKQILIKHPDKLPESVFAVDWKAEADTIERILPLSSSGTPSGETKTPKSGKKIKPNPVKKGGKIKDLDATKAKVDSQGEKTKAKAQADSMKTRVGGLPMWSPKVFTMLCRLSVHLPWVKSLEPFRTHAAKLPKPESKELIDGPGLVYSQFRESGVDMVARALQYYGFQDITKVSAAERGKVPAYAMFSGEVPIEQRAENLRIYNQPDNRQGKVIAMLLVTATGAEGIDTKGTTHLHAMEPYWHLARLNQFWSRAVRFAAFDDQVAERRFVQPYLYLAEYPRNKAGLFTEATTDVHLYLTGLRNKVLIDSFLLAIEEASIDCSVHHPSQDFNAKNPVRYHCHMCAPTNEPLFQNDLGVDLASPDTCRPLKESKIKAKSIRIGEAEYMYYVDADGIHVLELNPDLQAYEEIFSDHPDYFVVQSQVKKLKR